MEWHGNVRVEQDRLIRRLEIDAAIYDDADLAATCKAALDGDLAARAKCFSIFVRLRRET